MSLRPLVSMIGDMTVDELDALIDRTQGSPEAKRRTKIVLRNILGQLLNKEACKALGVGEAELAQLRQDALRGVIDSVSDDSPLN